MSNLRKLVDELSALTAIEAEELAALLDEQSGMRATSAIERLQALSQEIQAFATAEDSLHDLPVEDWLAAEALSLKAEATELGHSLDETLSYVRSRCDAVRRAA